MTDDNANVEHIAANVRATFEDTLDGASEFMKRQWRENPVGVVATAVGVGLILGLLLGRRR